MKTEQNTKNGFHLQDGGNNVAIKKSKCQTNFWQKDDEIKTSWELDACRMSLAFQFQMNPIWLPMKVKTNGPTVLRKLLLEHEGEAGAFHPANLLKEMSTHKRRFCNWKD
jgi:hypothetical protein